MMVRKPDETVQVNLRIKEGLRRKLEREATKHQVSLNQEMTARLEGSLEKETKRSLEDIASDLETSWHRFREILFSSDPATSLEILKRIAAMNKLAKTKDPKISISKTVGQGRSNRAPKRVRRSAPAIFEGNNT